MHIAMLSPIAWRTPPRHYGPWENIVSLITEGLVARGFQITLFATADSETQGVLHAVCPKGYEEDSSVLPKVWECLHISELFDHADEFDIIHNHFDFLPLTYTGQTSTPMVTTIHGFSSPGILPVYEKYNGQSFYVSISDADRSAKLEYIKTVHHGINLKQFEFQPKPEGDYLLFFGRIHPDKGAREAIEIALGCHQKLIMAGIIQDQDYYDQFIKPRVDSSKIDYIGSVGPKQRNQLLGNAAALLHPIHFNEPFGLSVIESMACGTPVIAFNKGSMPELIDDGENGFLVNNVAEAMMAVRQIKDIQRQNCRDHIEHHFTVERMVDDYIQVYESILQSKQREDHRPWGYYKILADNDHYKVKEIIIYPGKRLSLQRHQRRSEHWLFMAGKGQITLGDKTITVVPGASFDIPPGTLHRVANPHDEPVHFIEIQRGDYFGEDDIERLEDDFGRI